jgi:hypothetical protein
VVEQEARKHAEAERLKSEMPEGFKLEWIKQRYIEISRAQPDGTLFVRDFLAWIAHFSLGNAWWELALNDATGHVLRTDKSRTRGEA